MAGKIDQRIEISHFIGADYRGHGYMSEAVKGYAQYFFQNYHAATIFATARAENYASCKTLEKAGFRLFDTKLY